MSNAIPMALRPMSRVAYQWNAVTLAFARRYCAQQSCLSSTSQSPVFSALQSHSIACSSRPFSTSPRFAAKVHNPLDDVVPPKHPLPQQRKRTVKIGPLPDGMVDEGTIRRIFGARVTAVEGNHVLRILHHRRTSGSLADYGVDNLGSQYTHVSRSLTTKALNWLRETYPIDEARAAEEWAEKEANRIAYELWLADPENDSKYKDPARAFREQQKKEKAEREEQAALEERQDGAQKIGMLHVGPSQFERNIAERRRQRLEEIAKKAEEKERLEKEHEAKLATGEWVRTPGGTQLMKPGQTTYVDIFGREQVSGRKEKLEKYQQKAQTPFTDEAEMLSKTTLVQRLYPMSAFVLVVSLLCYGFAHYYIPPAPEYRLWPDMSCSTATIAAIVGINVAVCVAWRIAPLWPIMTRYFMHVPGYPRAIQSVLNVFSHVQYEHILGNMWIFCLVGPVCHDLVGRGVFLGTYIAAGAIGTLVSLYWANLGRGKIAAHSVGASAAIWGISALYCILTDQNTLKIPFVKDMEVSFYPKALFAAFVALEIWTAVKRKGKGTADHASHFGGLATGMGVAGYLHMTGFHQRTGAATLGGEGVQEKAGTEG
ncbi:hypothetical protein K458DRAFT_362508 [Lentithecium fluviatile CBS 122367]|uniref:Peptidase S54 rhomboid domain-containing protein n=1 Tax=Lentithecium fluviatile CBS 122367 TaxID=1168545 RepID=A0A6G1J8E5_9PLEO|nr:hypothetical protein K458DRAFT_362508 [Lentithecium fluviatile CBS 122367]